MKIAIVSLVDADPKELNNLYLRFPYPPYFGSPIVGERLQKYRLKCVQKAAEASPGTSIVAVNKGKVLCAVRLKRTNYLSDNLGIEIASIDNEAYVCDNKAENAQAFLLLLQHIIKLANRENIAFLTVSAASSCYQWIRALEDVGFRYADGFCHMVEDMKDDFNHLLLNRMVVRDPVESDFREILFSFNNVPFPSYLLYENEFNREKLVSLYANRYREVHESKNGRVFIGEIDGMFMGALNGVIDPDILADTGMIVNHLSQGIILHPRALGRGVALGLIAFRHNWYREMGMPYCYQGANINNIPMIRGFQKMKLRHAGIEIKMVLRLSILR